MKETKNIKKFIKVESALHIADKQVRKMELSITNYNSYYKLLDKQKKLSDISDEIYNGLNMEEKEYLFLQFGYDID